MRDAPRMYVLADLGPGAEAPLDGPDAHHLVNVLRLEAGAEVLAFNGRDGEWSATLQRRGKQAALSASSLARPQPPPASPQLHLAFAPLRRAQTSLLAEKATELGASALRPVQTSRTQNRGDAAARLHRTVRDAAAQCGRLSLPILAEGVSLEEYCAAETGPVLLCDEAGGPPLLDVGQALRDEMPGRVTLLVGPEGGFTDEERSGLRARGNVTGVSLGSLILRAETAAIVALAVARAALGEGAAAR